MEFKVRTNISSEFQNIEVCINAPEKNDFCKTRDGIYKIKEKLYYLEEVLPSKDFIRISNLYTVIISVFVGTTTLFLLSIPETIQLEMVNSMEKDSETLIEIGENYQDEANQISKKINEEKEAYGKDYPAEGIFLYQFISRFSTCRIIDVYSLALIIGIVLGTVIYIVAIQNTSKKQVIAELIVAFVILSVFMFILNVGYETIINKVINSINPTEVQYFTDIDIKNILILYMIVAVVVYVVNIIKQKILTNMLNKQLNIKQSK